MKKNGDPVICVACAHTFSTFQEYEGHKCERRETCKDEKR